MNDSRDSVEALGATSATNPCEQNNFSVCLKRHFCNDSSDVACVHFFLKSSLNMEPFRAPEGAFDAIETSRRGKTPAVRRIDVAVTPDAEGFESVERYVRYGLPVTVLLRGWSSGSPQHIERRLAWPPGDDDRYESVTKWVDEFIKATNTQD